MLSRSMERRRSQSGMTLIEVVLAMTISTILIVPLSMVFIASVRGSSTADDQLTRSGDAQRIGEAWTNDVQNVDVGGVNSSESCPAPDGFNGEETHLVTFSWNLSSSAQAAPRTATWVAIGAGEDLELVRRECEAGGLLDERMLAMKLGEEGQGVLDVVHGPGSVGSDFCPPVNKQTNAAQPAVWVSEACTIQVTGEYNYELTVSRRVPERVSGPSTAMAPGQPVINDTVGRNQYATISWGLLTVPAGQPAVEQYRVFLYTDPSGSPVSQVIADGASNFATFTSLVNDTQYWARVQARNRVGWGELSVPESVTPRATEPDAPTVPSVTPQDRSVTVNWTPNTNDGGSPVTSWRLYAIDMNNVEIGPTVISPGTQHSGTITGLTNGVAYRVVVAGVNSLGEGLRSDYSEVVRPYGQPPATGAVEALANDARVQVRWAPPADDNGRPIVGYVIRVFQGTNPTGPMSPAGTYYSNAQAACSATACEVNQTVANGAYYRFTVASRSEITTGGATIDGPQSSQSVPAPSPAVQPGNPPFVRPSTAPGTPTSPTLVRQSGTTLRASFVLPADGGEPIGRAFVEVQSQSTASGSQWSGWTQVDTNGFAISGAQGSTQSIDFSRTAGNNYRVRIAVANRGEWFSGAATWRSGPASAVSSAVTLVSVPSAPGTPTVVRTTNTTYPFSATTTWTRPSNNGGACLDAYEVRFSNDASTVVETRQATSTPSGTADACTGEPALSRVWDGITAGHATRYFSVRARNAGGAWSDWSGWGNTSALRQACTVSASKDSRTNSGEGAAQRGSDPVLEVRRSGTIWSYIAFDPRSNGSNCLQFGAALPAAAIVYGGPASTYSNNGTSGQVSVEAYQTEFPDCTLTTNSNQRAGIWEGVGIWNESTISWNTRPSGGARGDYTDEVRGGQSNGWRWWAVDTTFADEQRVASTQFGWILSHNDGNCNNLWKFHAREASSGAFAPRLNMVFY